MLTTGLFAALLITATQAPCTTPVLSYTYDARQVSADGFAQTCSVCEGSVTLTTYRGSRTHEDSWPITLPDIAAAMSAVGAASTDELCDGPMDTASVEYWIEGEAPVLFSAAGSACWIQSSAPEAAALESLVNRLCETPKQARAAR